MSEVVLLDTGCLVAVLFRRDQYHEWAVEKISQMPTPLITCEAVVAECCFLTQRMLGSSKAVFDFIETGAVKIDFSLAEEFVAVKDLTLRYENVPMSLADACLVRMSEIYENSIVFTPDSDFLIYRKNGNEIIPTIMPE